MQNLDLVLQILLYSKKRSLTDDARPGNDGEEEEVNEHANDKAGGSVRLKLQCSYHQNVSYQLADNQAHQALARDGAQLREETVNQKTGHQWEGADN